jgi:acyl carrier protein
MRAKLREIIEKTFYVPEDETLSDEDSLLDRGIIDSTGVLELISVLESEFGVQVADEEMVPENLDSIARIEAFVAKKKTAAGAA